MSRTAILAGGLLLNASLQAQTISSDVGTTICKGTTVVMTADSYADWEVSTDNGSNWTGIGSGKRFASSSIGNGHKYKVKSMSGTDPITDEPIYSYSNVLTFTVNGERAGINTISVPSRGSLSFNGSNQGFQMSSGFSVGTGAFTFETWFRLNEAPWENNYFVLLGAGCFPEHDCIPQPLP